jgi:hypothetical protein
MGGFTTVKSLKGGLIPTSDFHINISGVLADPRSTLMINTSSAMWAPPPTPGHWYMRSIGNWGDAYWQDPTHYHDVGGLPIIQVDSTVPLVPVVADTGPQVPSWASGGALLDTRLAGGCPIPADCRYLPRTQQNAAYPPYGPYPCSPLGYGPQYDDRHMALFDPARLYLWEFFRMWYDEAGIPPAPYPTYTPPPPTPGPASWKAWGSQFSDFLRRPPTPMDL